MRKKVNDQLASRASYAMVLRALGDDNATFEQRDRVTIDSIRNHTARHFPVQQVARATYPCQRTRPAALPEAWTFTDIEGRPVGGSQTPTGCE